MKTRIILSALIVALTAVIPASANISAKLREKIKPLAKTVQQIVKEEGHAGIAVGEFSGPAQFHTNFGSGLADLLTQELDQLQPGLVKPDAPISVKGDFELVRRKDMKVVEIALNIRKSNGEKISKLTKELLEQPLEISDSELIAALTGRTVDLPAGEGKQDLNRRIQESIEKPTFSAKNALIRTSEKSLFGVELLVAPVGKAPATAEDWAAVPARSAANTNGQPFVGIERNEVYALRIHNFSKHEAAVAINIDGLDVFAFSEIREKGQPKYKVFICEPGTTIIPGWHLTNDKALSFLVTENGKGAISKTPNAVRGKVGIVTLSFALAWSGDNVPAEEKGTRSATSNETGFGPPVTTKQEEVQRHIGVVREMISVRYNR